MKSSPYFALAACAAFLAWGCAQQPESTSTTTGGAPSNELTPNNNKGAVAAVDFEKDVKPTIDTYCAKCHSGEKPAGQVDVTKLDPKADGAKFMKMAGEVEGGKMPPPKGTPIPDAEKPKFIENLKKLAG